MNRIEANPVWTEIMTRALIEMKASGANLDDIRGVLLGSLVGICYETGLDRESLHQGVDQIWRGLEQMAKSKGIA